MKAIDLFGQDRMKEAYIADLKPGTSINTTFLVRSKERKTARNGSAYLDLEFQDSTGTIKAKLWDCDGLTPLSKPTILSAFRVALKSIREAFNFRYAK